MQLEGEREEGNAQLVAGRSRTSVVKDRCSAIERGREPSIMLPSVLPFLAAFSLLSDVNEQASLSTLSPKSTFCPLTQFDPTA
jgi:hypothetical protein